MSSVLIKCVSYSQLKNLEKIKLSSKSKISTKKDTLNSNLSLLELKSNKQK